MKRSCALIYLPFYFFLLILFSQCSGNATPAPSNISLYIYESNNRRTEPDVGLFIKQKPALIMDEESVQKVKLIQTRGDEFAIEIQLSEHVNGEMERITSANIGKRLVFMSDNRILFALLILQAVSQGRIVIELPSMKKADAENIARSFSSSFDFFDNQPYRKERVDPDLKKAYQLRDKGEYDKAIQLFEQVLKEKQRQNTKILLYNET